MILFKYISCVIAILSTLLYISSVITLLNSGSEIYMPWKPDSKVTGFELNRTFRRICGIIMALFWSVVIVL